jgi:uncharacterized membrane protein YphA (DoxX/SURF4 family)
MNIVLWIVQALLALAFLGAGILKATQPLDKLKVQMKWVEHSAVWFVRFVGIVEILGALGLILPALTHILSWLTPTAAVGLVLTMIGAAYVHIKEKDFKGLSAPIVLLILSLLIVIGRFVLVPLV